MEKKSTVVTIAIITVIALGLTIYEENVEKEDVYKTNMVESNAPSDYETILGK